MRTQALQSRVGHQGDFLEEAVPELTLKVEATEEGASVLTETLWSCELEEVLGELGSWLSAGRGGSRTELAVATFALCHAHLGCPEWEGR